MPDRYSTSHLLEDQYEPGSDCKVLRNLIGITDPEEMGIAETEALWRVQEKLIGEVTSDQSFREEDICEIHRQWLGDLYAWAGIPRQVNIGKGGFQFAMAQALPSLLTEFERRQLRKYTPCQFENRDDVAHALAEVHVEFTPSGKGTVG